MPIGLFETASSFGCGAGALSALIVLADVCRGRRQTMRVMEFVWAMTALYSGPIGLWAYFTMGRAGRGGGANGEKPFWQRAFVSTCHCGAGCALGDVIGEALAFALALSLFDSRMKGAFALDFVVAYAAGLALQYVVIKPMRDLSSRRALVAAFKADTVSIVAFQIGMYLWMVASMRLTGPLRADDVRYWSMMRVAMVVGFAFSYPANWFLLKKGIKEAM